MKISPEKWERVKALFEAALQREPASRTQFLAQACPEDDLRNQVEKLLLYHQQAGSFMGQASDDPRNLSRSETGGETYRAPESFLEQDASRKGVLDRVAQDAPLCNMPAGRSIGQRAQWGMWIVAASFALNFALVNYLDFAGPSLGIVASLYQTVCLVTKIYPRSPADFAGLQPGDRIRRVDGLLIGSYWDWASVLLNLRVGEPRTFEIRRGNETVTLSIVPQPRWTVGYEGPFQDTPHAGAANLWGHVSWRTGQLVMLGLACFLAFARPRDRSAVIASLFFAGLSSLNIPETLTGVYTMLRQLPTMIFALFCIAWVASGLTAPLFFTFCATFPRPLFRSRRLWMLIWMPSLLVLASLEVLDTPMIFDRHHSMSALSASLSHAFSLSMALYFVAGMFAVVANYRRLTDVTERRRIRVVVFGSVVGLLALTPLVILFGLPGLRGTFWGDLLLSPPVLIASVISSFLLFPLTFVYSILRHRLFDVRIIIRRGLQYAMARGVLLSIIPLLAAVFLADMFVQGDKSLMAVLKMRGWVYSGLGIFAAVIYRKRKEWLDQIDRRFFRDRFDAQRLLQEVIQQVKDAKNFGAAGAEVVIQIQKALHSGFVRLLHRKIDQTKFRTMAGAPAGNVTPGLHADTKLIGLLRVTEKPIQFFGSAWVTDRLPSGEIQLIEQQHIDLIVPIVMGSDGEESLLILGPKRSEEPYSREDETLLTAIASSLALLSARSVTQVRDTQAFLECPTCGACFNAGESHCNQDGSGLVQIRMPRRLVGRYRLDRRIGSGGMGTVYAGVDDALDRPVAIKVIRSELIQQPHLTAKFHQEARAAAGLIHRNVITVYDFGVELQHPFIIMELLVGHTLRAELDRAKPFSPDRTVEILEGVCAAVEEAHRRQLLHRDLKPENIFLAQTPTGEVVKVLDFGLVKALSTGIRSDAATTTGTSVIAGTPYYMAPEQLVGETVSPSTDVWALGVIAYEMLMGTHPFVPGSVATWRNAVLNGRFTPIHPPQPAVSQDWQTFFGQVFEPDQKRRINSVRAFLENLQLVVGSQNPKTESKSNN